MSVVCRLYVFFLKKIAPNSKSRSRIILFLCEDARSIRMVTKAMLANVGYVLCLEGRGQRLCQLQLTVLCINKAFSLVHPLNPIHITPNSAFNSFARSSIPAACGSSLTIVFASFKHLSQQHFPKPQALNSSCRCLYPSLGFT